MKTKPQHTPTPWKVMHNEIGLEWNIEAGNELIAVLVPKNQRNLDNAAFIVRAVNSHEALLSALKNIRSNIEALPEIIKRGAVLVGDWETVESMKIFADEAIAQAEGK